MLLSMCERHILVASEVVPESSTTCSLVPSHRLKRLELPTSQDSTPGCRFVETLSKQSDDFFERSIAVGTFLECALSTRRSGKAFAWMPALEPKRPSEWDAYSEEYPVIQHQEQVVETIKDDQDEHLELKKIKHDEGALQVPGSFLRTESTSVLKKVVRKNAAPVLTDKMDFFKIPAVAQVALHSWNPWQFSFADISSDSAIESGSDPQMQQLVMPSRLAHEDEKKPDDAVVRLVDSGAQILQRMLSSSSSLPPRPLTSIMLNIPSLWSFESVSGAVAGRFGEVFEWKQAPASGEERDQGDTGNIESLKQSEIIQHLTKADSEIKSIAEETTKAEEPPLGDEVQHPRAILLLPNAGPATTEDLVSGFFGATSNQLVVAEERAASTSAISNTVQEVSMDHQKRLPMEHLARPVLWDLARKKVIRVNPNSVQCALETLSLELLESIIFQQQGNIKKISKNPSAFSHEAIFDACTSFRQSTWLHTLR